jgi:hypothetical protein
LQIEFYGKVLVKEDIKRIYPVVTIKFGGEITDMSLEWADTYLENESVEFLGYFLVFDFDMNRQKQEKIQFSTREDLIAGIGEIYKIMENK